MICNKCNNQISDDSVFCPFCGNQINATFQNNINTYNQSDNKVDLMKPMESNNLPIENSQNSTPYNNYNQNYSYQSQSNENITNPNMPIEKGMKARSKSVYLAWMGIFTALCFSVRIGLLIAISSLIVAFIEKKKIDEQSFKKAIIMDVICIIIVVLYWVFWVFMYGFIYSSVN